MVHVEVAIVVHGIGVVVGPSGGGGGDIEAAQIEVPGEVPTVGAGPESPYRSAVQVASRVDIPAPGLRRNDSGGLGGRKSSVKKRN